MANPKAKQDRSYTNQVDIDGKKLAKEFKKRGLSYADVGKAIGLSGTSVCCYANKNECSKIFLKAIESTYGIKFEDVKPEEKKQVEVVVEEKKQEVPTTCGIDYDRLYEVIFKAVSDALKA